jgi:hypothetical protein
MSARPFLMWQRSEGPHSIAGQCVHIAAGPVHDMHSPWWTIGVGGAVLLAVMSVVTVATWIAWGCGLAVGESRR